MASSEERPSSPTAVEDKKMTGTDDTASESPRNAVSEAASEPEYPSGIALILISTSLFLAAFCLGLDRTIITTAIPKITSEFSSLPDIGWYGSAYTLTTCCVQLVFGKLSAELNVKWVFLFALSIFEVGSIICAAAPNSPVLIAGRAIAGIGAAGIMTGALVILSLSVPLHTRPRLTGAVGGVVCIAQIVAPTLGGAFTDYATWRWSFWINLPIGAVAAAIVVFLVHIPPSATARPKTDKDGSLVGIAKRFDLLGSALLMPSLICLLLALQWGGTKYSWNSWRSILTLTLFAATFVAWILVQYRAGDNATVPPRLITNRSMASAVWYMFCGMAVLSIIVSFMPVWFQSAKAVSAYQSGINLLAFTAAMSVSVIASGFITSKVGYYVPQMIAGTVAMSIAAGLITRYNTATSSAYWIGTLVLFGFGIGIGGQQPIMVPQTLYSGPDASIGMSMMIFAQTLSGTIWISVGNNIFQDRLVAEIETRAPGVDPKTVVAAGAGEIAISLGKIYPDAIGQILEAYSAALRQLWVLVVILACLGALGCVFIEWKSVKRDVKGGGKAAPVVSEKADA
ncbi:major facilitator superfamily domain-containing protein [Echria macrotheca]|uniref:Major facilitator superfamily domain-containing protein n=1 Tax=Echria macrotheca TaxID=438768 RepID=A0AAJ0B5U4_9PEZI|nr:major facilitator superfamily domain-containing protein [Echria macrotheca]